MSGISDYSNRGNSSRLMLYAGAMLVCCVLTVIVIMKGESGSFFTMKASVQFSLETEPGYQGQHGSSAPDFSVVELYGDVPPLSKSTPMIFESGDKAGHGYSFTVRFPMEAVGKSLNYRIVLRSDAGYGTEVARISGTVSLAGGNTIVVIDETTMKSGNSAIRHHPGQIVDLR